MGMWLIFPSNLWVRFLIRRPIRNLTDGTARKIVRALQADGRQPWSALAKLVGLSAPAVAERVRRLEEAGVIRGYYAELAPESLGFTVTAFMRISAPATRYDQVIAKSKRMPEVLECHHVLGGDSFLLKILARDVKHLEQIINEFSSIGQTGTTIVLSTPVAKRGLDPGAAGPRSGT
jgi:Lrp/AsnC family transcriptional regulator, leucine-responsive regulatory protein